MQTKMISSVVWNSGSQLYMALVAILVIPVFTKYFGPDAYGLIAFSVLLQSIMNMLDLGLSSLLNRESSRFRAGISDGSFFKSLLCNIRNIFFGVGLFIFALLAIGADFIATSWLKSGALDKVVVVHSIQMVACILAIRWVCIYYRSIVFGFDALKWLAIFNVSISTSKFLIIIPLMTYFDFGIIEYFIYQLIVQISEIILLRYQANRLVSFPLYTRTRALSKAEFTSTMSFCIAVGASALLWIATTQLDKLLVSAMSALADFSYFYIAVTVAGVITVLTSPIVNAALPKVTMLYANGQQQQTLQVFRILISLVVVLVLPTCALMWLFGSELLYVWSNDHVFAEQVAPVLKWYLVGNSVLGISSVSYLLNFADGDLKLRNLSSLFLLSCIAIFAPIGIYFGGVEGCSWVWCASTVVYFFLWQPILIRKFSDSAFKDFLSVDLLPAAALIVLISYLMDAVELSLNGTVEVLVYSSLFWALLAVLTVLSSRTSRQLTVHWIRTLYA